VANQKTLVRIASYATSKTKASGVASMKKVVFGTRARGIFTVRSHGVAERWFPVKAEKEKGITRGFLYKPGL
jgi:hypothetical protein